MAPFRSGSSSSSQPRWRDSSFFTISTTWGREQLWANPEVSGEVPSRPRSHSYVHSGPGGSLRPPWLPIHSPLCTYTHLTRSLPAPEPSMTPFCPSYKYPEFYMAVLHSPTSSPGIEAHQGLSASPPPLTLHPTNSSFRTRGKHQLFQNPSLRSQGGETPGNSHILPAPITHPRTCLAPPSGHPLAQRGRKALRMPAPNAPQRSFRLPHPLPHPFLPPCLTTFIFNEYHLKHKSVPTQACF